MDEILNDGYKELARRWWSLFQSSVETDEPTCSTDEMLDLEHEVSVATQSLRGAARFISELGEIVANRDSLPYIGTRVLEEFAIDWGHRAVDVLRVSSLDEETRKLIVSGVARRYR